MDNALLIAPALFYILRNRTGGTSLLKTTSVLALGMLPFILWEVFSILYYGFPFPNTAYAKISSGFPQTDYLMRGAGYFFYTVLLDCITLLPPFALAILAWRKRLIKLLYISAGMFLYHVYLLKVGGDFMLGRHYTTMFFIAVFALSNTHANNLWTFDFAKKFSRPKTVFISFCAALLVFQSVIGAAHAWEPLWLWLGKKRFFTPTLRDERQRFFNYASLRARLRDYLDFRAVD
jgi:arabinofuranosyltransferase